MITTIYSDIMENVSIYTVQTMKEEEIMAISEISKNALTVLERRYLAKDEDGNLTETVEEMFRRVSDTIAAVDAVFDLSLIHI